MATREDIEIAKLELEVKALARPYFHTHAFWISVITAAVAIVGVYAQSYLSKIEAAQAKLDKTSAEELAAKAKKDLEVLSTTRDKTRAQIQSLESFKASLTLERDELQKRKVELTTQIASVQDELKRAELERDNIGAQSAKLVAAANATGGSAQLRAAATATENSKFTVAIYTLGVQEPEASLVQQAIKAKGYTILSSDALDTRPSWLSATTAVLYYDNSSFLVARALAATLETAIGGEIAVAKGAGLGIPKGREKTSLRVHIVQK